MSFEYSYSNYDSDGIVDQGTLASTYTNALASYLQGEEGADIVAFLAYTASGGDVDAALALKAEVEAGNFTLSDLFGAAQSKTGAVDGATISDPDPKLTVIFTDGTSVTVSLAKMLTGPDTETWSITSKTSTIYHTREFFSGSLQPDGYGDDWAVQVEAQNEAPTASPLSWDVTEYDEHAVANSGPVEKQIDLLSTTGDPESDSLSVVAGSVKIVNDDGTFRDLPTYLRVDGSNLVIDTNSPEFDALYLNAAQQLNIVYEITDGTNTISNTVDLTITGTADKFSSSTDATASISSGFDTKTWDGDFTLALTAPSGAFDFSGTATVTVTGDIDLDAANNINDELVIVTLEGGDSVTLGALSAPPNLEKGSYSTDSAVANFTSNDASISVTYDSNTADGANGVDALALVEVKVSADYDYWM